MTKHINRFDPVQELTFDTTSDVLTTGNRSHVLTALPRSFSSSFSLSLSHTNFGSCSSFSLSILSLRYEKLCSRAVNLQRVCAVRHYRRWLRERNQFSSRRAPSFSAPHGVYVCVRVYATLRFNILKSEILTYEKSAREIRVDNVEKLREKMHRHIWYTIL